MLSISYYIIRFYAYLPTWLGGYDGSANESVCSQITNVVAEHWKLNEQVCEELILRKFFSKCLGAFVLLSFVLAFHVIQFATHYCLKRFCDY